MQLHQGYLLSVGEKYFLVRGQVKLTQQLWDSMDPTPMDPTAILLLIKFLLEFINLNKMNAKQVVFVGNFSVAGSLNSIKDYWDKLTAIDPKYGYFPKPTK